jgi:tetratricopeptide (TPR) repeat protein
MSLTAAPAKSILRRAPPGPPEIPFPVSARPVSRLRRLRDRFTREGRLDLALQIAEEVARRDPGRESLFRLGALYRDTGNYQESLKKFRDALRFGDGPKYLIPEIHIHLAHTWYLLRKRKRMVRALRRAYALRPRPRSDGNFHTVYGTELMTRGRYREAVEVNARAEAFARTARQRGSHAFSQGLALFRLGDLEGARECASRSLRFNRAAGDLSGMAEARIILAAIRFDQGQYRRALGMFVRAAQVFRECGIRDREAEAFTNAGYTAGEAGLWDRSRALLNKAIRLNLSLGDRVALVQAYACRASACANLGEPEVALEDLVHARRYLRGMRSWMGTLHFCRAQARVAALRGDWAGARRAARHGERVASRVGDLPRVAEFRRMRARAEGELGRRRASSYARGTAARVEGLLSAAPSSLREVERQVARLAAADLPVLVVGESSQGRLDLARRLHGKSRRSKGPFVVVPCEQLIFPAAEIGGQERGMWTGNDRGSPGYAGQARGGTLVLDRVDELPAEAQKVLVPVLDRKVRRVGGTTVELDARIVATCCAPGRLIPDLERRLSGAVLRIPAIGRGGRDVARLVSRSLGGRRRITPDALAELARRPWDGGQAEILAAVERLVILSDGTIGEKLVRRNFTVTESCRPGPRVHKTRPSRRMAAVMA